MAGKSAFAIRAEYLLLRAVAAAANAIPYSAAMLLARGAARLCLALGVNRRRTYGRIRAVFPEKTAREVKRIALDSLHSLFATAVEMARAPRCDRARIVRHVADVERYAAMLRKVVDEGRGVVIMVPHSGNWYMAARAMASCGIPLFAVGAQQRNPLVYGWMKRSYGERLEVLERGTAGTLREIVARLRSGKAFAILPDIRSPSPDVEVPFLGGVANVSHGGAMLAVAAGCPIVVAAMGRRGGRHEFHYLATLRPDPAAADRTAEARRLTGEVFKLLDKHVRSAPGDWFWYNKRWILQEVKRKKRKA